MALMEYCLVNIVLGDNEGKPPNEVPKVDKIFNLAKVTESNQITTSIFA